MMSRRKTAGVISLAFLLLIAGAVNVFGQELNKIPSGQQVKKFKGIVSKREPDSFTMGDTMGGAQTLVLLTPTTEVKSHKRGVFRGSKDYGSSYILRGLRLEVDGVGNAVGTIFFTLA